MFFRAVSFNLALCEWDTSSVTEFSDVVSYMPKLSLCDVNECVSGAHSCDANAECTNTDASEGQAGAFEEEEEGNGGRGPSPRQWRAGTREASRARARRAYVPSFECACNTGYVDWSAGALGARCEEDRCSKNTHGCSPNAACVNTEGSFDCICNAGFETTDDGVTCTDVIECGASDNCDAANGVCDDADGSFTCSCNAGFALNDDARTCDEITKDCVPACNGNTVCVSAVCVCTAGFRRSGPACEDADECAAGADNNCDANAACANTDGSFTCACNSGFSGSDGTECANIDECMAGSDNCDGNGACTDTDGSFTCWCNAGFSGSGTTCEKDEAEVSFQAVLAISEAEFGAAQRQTYKEVVASVAGVDASVVSIKAVTPVVLSSRRRLLAVGISVETVVSGLAEQDTAA
eukprot:1033650-Rhodomonas_salina.2